MAEDERIIVNFSYRDSSPSFQWRELEARRVRSARLNTLMMVVSSVLVLIVMISVIVLVAQRSGIQIDDSDFFFVVATSLISLTTVVYSLMTTIYASRRSQRADREALLYLTQSELQEAESKIRNLKLRIRSNEDSVNENTFEKSMKNNGVDNEDGGAR